MLVVVALVDTIVFVLAARLWGTYTAMFRDSPIYCSVRTIMLGGLALNLVHSFEGWFPEHTLHHTMSLLGYKCIFPW